MSESTTQEPTMEEILASIRRIISEDEAPAETASAAAAPEPEPAEDEDQGPDEVLELTQRYEEPAPVAASAPEPVEQIGDLDVGPADPFPVEPSTPYQPEPEPMSAPPAASLVSDRTAEAASSAFASLTQSLILPREGRSLEDLVKELMTPLLKTWLDENLPAIVEAEVRAEVERIARRGGR